MSHILIIGGAGYIGSHVALALLEQGYEPIILDNLSEGHKESILGGIFIEGNMEDRALLKHIFSTYDISIVMHFAGYIAVGESVLHPGKYYHNNVVNTHVLLEEMIHANVKNIIFSSTCATYGTPQFLPFTEEHPQAPINPYGRTKLMIEHMLQDYEIAYGLRSVVFRYFNAAGADPLHRIGEAHRHETHLIPNILRAAKGELPNITIYGNAYDTPDGTCIRDYIHVLDIADAHIRGMNTLLNHGKSGIYNLANGEGYSVKEVIETAKTVTGKNVPVIIAPPRTGDPARLIGNATKAFTELGWTASQSSLNHIIQTAWDWELRR